MQYTTINHDARKTLKLTWHEYGLADIIFRLSASPGSKHPGWCYATKEYLAEELGLTKRSVTTMIAKLISMRIIEKDEKTKYIRSSMKWYETAIERRGKKLPSDREETSLDDREETSLPYIRNENKSRDIQSDNNIATPCVAVEKTPKEKDPINQVMEAFQVHLNPMIQYGNKTQRQAVQDLIRQIGLEKTISSVQFIAQNRDDNFCPVITTPYMLKQKLAQLILFARKQTSRRMPEPDLSVNDDPDIDLTKL